MKKPTSSKNPPRDGEDLSGPRAALAAAEKAVKTAAKRAHLAKRKRNEAKEALRLAKKQLKLAKKSRAKARKAVREAEAQAEAKVDDSALRMKAPKSKPGAKRPPAPAKRKARKPAPEVASITPVIDDPVAVPTVTPPESDSPPAPAEPPTAEPAAM